MRWALTSATRACSGASSPCASPVGRRASGCRALFFAMSEVGREVGCETCRAEQDSTMRRCAAALAGVPDLGEGLVHQPAVVVGGNLFTDRLGGDQRRQLGR